jgi:UDP-glucuronate decarboxylase
MSLLDSRVIPTYIKKVIKGEKLSVFGDGQETRTFCYGTDFITGAIKILLKGNPGSVWNLGNDTPEISMANLAYMMRHLGGNDCDVEFLPYPDVYKKQPQRRCPDLTKIREELGYNPTVLLLEGLNRYYTWAKTVI